jgi:peptidylprolyl isomerase
MKKLAVGGVALIGALPWMLALSHCVEAAPAAAAPSDVPPDVPPDVPSDVATPPAQAVHTSSGVAMMVLARGRGRERPRDNDCVKVHYVAWKRDGSLLSSSLPPAKPQNQCLRATFPGVAEALKAMVVGEKRRVWVPAGLTYAGDDDDHPPLVDATFDLELVEIQRAPPTPSHLDKPPRAARKLPSGLAIQVMKRGTATRHPGGNEQVMLHFSGWTRDGRLIESSIMANHAAVFSMAAVIAGWREALGTMVVGDKVRIWIPEALAYPRPRRGQPRGDLVYDLELLGIL